MSPNLRAWLWVQQLLEPSTVLEGDRGGRALSPPCCGGDGEHTVAVVVLNVEVNLMAVLRAPVASLCPPLGLPLGDNPP